MANLFKTTFSDPGIIPRANNKEVLEYERMFKCGGFLSLEFDAIKFCRFNLTRLSLLNLSLKLDAIDFCRLNLTRLNLTRLNFVA